MKVLAIDPGFRTTGWVRAHITPERPVLHDCGIIRTAKSQRRIPVAHDDWACLQHIADELARVGDFDVIVVEAPEGSQSVSAAKAMAYAYAVCAVLASTCDAPSVVVRAKAAKTAVCGTASASKLDVEAATIAEWPELRRAALDAVGRARSRAEHIYDAAALVWAAWDSDVMRMARRSARG